jgi:hypothetical protein
MGSGALGELLAECEVKRGHVKKIEKGLEAHREFEKHRDGETHRETQRQSEACLSTEQRPPRDVRRLNRQLEGTIAAMDELREIKEECLLRTSNMEHLHVYLYATQTLHMCYAEQVRKQCPRD